MDMKLISKVLALILILSALIPFGQAPLTHASFSQTTLSGEGYPLVAAYSDQVPEGLIRKPLYTKYNLPRHYLVMMGTFGNIRTKPSTSGTILKKMVHTEKLGVLEAVKGQTVNQLDTWYKVFWYSGGKKRTGYIHGALVAKREFNFDLALEQAVLYKAEVEGRRIGHISNFRNQRGVAPKFDGKEVDNFGVQRYQATAAYAAPDLKSKFRYLQDGRVVEILDETDGFFQVFIPDLNEEFFVPKKFVFENGALKALNQLIFIDRKQQNIISLQWENENWRIVSYNQATTGASDKYRNPTDLGLFLVLNKKPKFDYLDDETKLIDGYAPYAIRFNGGAFIHGVPVAYIIEKEETVIKPAVLDAKGKVIKPAVMQTKILSKKDPGEVEYLSSIGTIPRSHKCVRNYTSHAKFLYEWVKVGQAAVVVFE